MKTFLNQLAVYLFLKKKDPNQPTTLNYRLMHGMNRISLILFLLALILVLYRLFTN
jgi:hypothetical protein